MYSITIPFCFLYQLIFYLSFPTQTEITKNLFTKLIYRISTSFTLFFPFLAITRLLQGRKLNQRLPSISVVRVIYILFSAVICKYVELVNLNFGLLLFLVH